MTEGSSCPIPISDYPVVTLAHGGGGRLMRQLVEKMFAAAFDNRWLREAHDASVFDAVPGRVALTTDSYVVRPRFFPGGDIGRLAVNGTVNDLAMSGAEPAYLTCSLIIEEGLPMEELWRAVTSMADAARAAGVEIVTGDTKVVDRGQGDGLYVNTAGVGWVPEGRVIAPARVCPGDAVIVSGDVARHGMAVMAKREGLEFESAIESDCAPVNGQVRALFEAGVDVRCLRDLTRGGLASAVVEIADARGVAVELDETRVPVRGDVRGACELLGLDPLYVANEGRFVAFVAEPDAGKALAVLDEATQDDQMPAVIGRVGDEVTKGRGRVTLRSAIGGTRVLDLLSGDQLPRIC